MTLSTDDRLAIHDLYARNAWALDTGEVEAFVELFVADAVVDWAAEHKGSDAIRRLAENFRKHDPWLPGSQHVISQIVIDGEGDRARVRAYVQRVHRLGGHRRNNCNVVWTGHYDDEVVKLDGRWLFQRQTAKAWEGRIQARVADARRPL